MLKFMQEKLELAEEGHGIILLDVKQDLDNDSDLSGTGFIFVTKLTFPEKTRVTVKKIHLTYQRFNINPQTQDIKYGDTQQTTLAEAYSGKYISKDNKATTRKVSLGKHIFILASCVRGKNNRRVTITTLAREHNIQRCDKITFSKDEVQSHADLLFQRYFGDDTNVDLKQEPRQPQTRGPQLNHPMFFVKDINTNFPITLRLVYPFDGIEYVENYIYDFETSTFIEYSDKSIPCTFFIPDVYNFAPYITIQLQKDILKICNYKWIRLLNMNGNWFNVSTEDEQSLKNGLQLVVNKFKESER